MARDDYYASLFGALFSAYMEHPLPSRAIARVIWGGDMRPYYESMRAIGDVPDGGTIVDCPCGAGPALRELRPDAAVRYVAADLSPAMLRRARKRAKRRGVGQVELAQAEATDLPLPADSADLFLSYWGLHCFPDPRGALIEAARVLKPSGRLVGSCLVCGRDSLRQRLLIRPGVGDFGPVGTQEEVDAWLEEAGFVLSSRRRAGPMLYFEGSLASTRPSSTAARSNS